MIRFPCRCGEPLDVPSSEAGGIIQCPKCGKLNDVPGLDDLGQIDRDGGYKVSGDRPAADGQRDADRSRQTARALRNGGRDAKGRSRDLRPTLDEFLLAGTTADTPTEAADLKPKRPKYDPVTGELVRPLDLRQEPLRAEPVRSDEPDAAPQHHRAKGKLTYANRETADPSVPPRRVPLELFAPANVTVMFFVYLGLCLLIFAAAVLPIQLVIMGFLPMIVLILVIVAHFGNVVEETGPTGRDELPAPLREFNLGADIWTPAVHVLFAFFTCLGPGLFMLAYAARLARWKQVSAVDPSVWIGGGWALVGLGTLLFPAALLTACTAGSALVNTAPLRLIGTARACGKDYLASLLLFALAAIAMAVGLAFSAAHPSLPESWHLDGKKAEIVYYLLGLPTLAVGVYFSHLFCWHLGLLYRLHHTGFPWLYQRHEGRRDDAMKQLEGRRAERREKIIQARLARLEAKPRAARPLPQTRPTQEPLVALPVEPLED